MLNKPCGNVIAPNAWHCSNALASIAVTVEGISTVASFLQLNIALSGIVVNAQLNLIEVISSAPINA